METERQFRKSNRRQHIALALMARGSGGVTVEQQITNITNVTQVIDQDQAPFQQEPRVKYVDTREGSDEPGEDALLHGAYNHPFKSVHAALDAIGNAASQGEFEKPWTIRVRGDGQWRDVGQNNDGVIHLPQRRLRIELQAGLWLLNRFQWDINNAARHGSTQFWHLQIVCPGGKVCHGEPAGNLNAMSARVGDGTNFLTLTADAAASRDVVLTFDGVGVHGSILHDDNFVAADIAINARGTHFVAGRIGPTIVGSAHKIDVNQLVDCMFNSVVACKVRLLANAENCIIANDWDVAAAPSAAGSLVGQSGVRDCWVDATASWTGPAGSLWLDGVTNHFCKTNAAAGFLAAVKTVIDDLTP